jgi:hypothetical protein
MSPLLPRHFHYFVKWGRSANRPNHVTREPGRWYKVKMNLLPQDRIESYLSETSWLRGISQLIVLHGDNIKVVIDESNEFTRKPLDEKQLLWLELNANYVNDTKS